MSVAWTAFLIVLALISAESRVQKHRGLTVGQGVEVPQRHPYLFLNVPRGHSDPIYRGFKIVEEVENDERANAEDEVENVDEDIDDYNEELDGKLQAGSIRAALVQDDIEANGNDYDDDRDNDDDDDDDNAQNAEEPIGTKKKKNNTSDSQKVIQNAMPQRMMVSKEHAGALMVPDGIIEIEGQSVVDEKTGKVSLLVPQAALDAIPDGSIVALMERSATDTDAADAADAEEEERANRVIVRRRRLGSRRNVRRQVNGNVNRRRVNGNGNRRRRVNNRTNVRVIRPNNVRRRRQGNRRRTNRPIIYQF